MGDRRHCIAYHCISIIRSFVLLYCYFVIFLSDSDKHVVNDAILSLRDIEMLY